MYKEKLVQRLSINDFIDYCKKNPNEYRQYCEVILDRFGNVIPVRPSHQETLIKMVQEKYNLTKEEVNSCIEISLSPLHFIISKENYISVWYNHVIYHNINSRQRKSLVLLQKNKLISEEVKSCYTDEYGLYLRRVEIGMSETCKSFEELSELKKNNNSCKEKNEDIKWYEIIRNYIEMTEDHKNWIKGRIIEGYRTGDGMVNMIAENGLHWWAPVSSEGYNFRATDETVYP